MRFSATLAVLFALANTSLAAYRVAHLGKRQGNSFTPPTVPGSCNPNDGWVHCGSGLCIQPGRGDICCDASQDWGCPGGSFCLVNGLCCPDGDDPQTCADDQGVSLPPNFNTNPVSPATSSSPPASTSTSVSTTSSTYHSSSSAISTYSSASTATYTYPSSASTYTSGYSSSYGSYSPTTSGSTYPISSTSSAYYTSSSTSYESPPPPTGAANALQGGAMVAQAVGVAAWLAAAL